MFSTDGLIPFMEPNNPNIKILKKLCNKHINPLLTVI